MPPFTPSPPASFGAASSSTAHAVPSDPSEISATAQALLQTHYGRLHPSSTSPDSQRSTLAKLESAARNIDRMTVTTVAQLNAWDVLRNRTLLISKDGLNKLIG